MDGIVKALYNCAYTIWNSLIEIAMTLFRTSPKAAGYGTPCLFVFDCYAFVYHQYVYDSGSKAYDTPAPCG